MKQLIIDTDIGTDVDDLIALIYAMRNPNVKVEAIATVHGNTKIRAKIVRKLERILGADIPIFAGAEKTLEGSSNYWCGFEHKALTKQEIEEPLANSYYPNLGKDTALVCIGPLTNIALYVKNDNGINKVKNIYFMGSHKGSHNFKVDPEATRIVLSQPWKKFFITKSVSQKIRFSRKELSDLRGNQLGDFVYESAVRWLDYSKKENSYMYDVLTVSAAIGEKFVKFREKNGGMFSYDVDSSIKERIVEAIKNGI